MDRPGVYIRYSNIGKSTIVVEYEREGTNMDYNTLDNKPIIQVESLDAENPVIIRDLSDGQYILVGRFKPYKEATTTLVFSSGLLVNIVKKTSKSSVQIFYPVNNCVQFLEITDDTYTRTNVYLNDLQNNQLPAVTESDNGKTLQVVDGKWAVV